MRSFNKKQVEEEVKISLFCEFNQDKITLNCNIVDNLISYVLHYEAKQNCALAKRTILYLHIPGFQRKVFKSVPKCNKFF